MDDKVSPTSAMRPARPRPRRPNRRCRAPLPPRGAVRPPGPALGPPPRRPAPALDAPAPPPRRSQVLTRVLEECGDNIDQAIRRLNELQLKGRATRDATGAPPGAGAGDPAPRPAAPGGGDSAAEAGPAGPVPRSAAEWVEAMVGEMQAATDLGDARARAARFLRAFEDDARERAAEAGRAEAATLRKQVETLTRDQAILKRAVTIQNQRMQENQLKDQELAELRQLVQSYRERNESLELSNYSLSVHLRHAFSPGDHHRPPDVF